MAKVGFSVNINEFAAAIGATRVSALEIEQAGAKVLIRGMKQRVAVDTGKTQRSIDSHITESSAEKVVDEIGPETDYAWFIEYGIVGRPGYPIQPFVRPTAADMAGAIMAAIKKAFVIALRSIWS